MRGAAALLVLAAAAAAPACAAPPPGRYAATLCVGTVQGQPPSCGAAEFELAGNARAEVRVADVVYRLRLKSAQVDVKTMQGRMEIDEFSAPYEWHGKVLSFVDPDKNVRYEITPGTRVRTKR